MAKPVRVVWAGGAGWRSKGVRLLERGTDMQRIVKDLGETTLRNVGGERDGYELQVFQGRARWRATVRTKTTDARVDQAKTRSLLQAVQSARRR